MELTRRGFFGLLAALPFIGRFRPTQWQPESIYPEAIKDEYFKDGPLLAYLKSDQYRLTYEGKPIVADPYAPPLSDPL